LLATQKVLSESISVLAKDFATDYRLRKADGMTIWVRSKGSAYLLPDGKITAFGTTTDITESKKAEEDLLEANRDAEKSHARYEQVVSMISDMVWRHDVDAHGQYVASYISPVADRILGLPNGTIGNNFEKIFLIYSSRRLAGCARVAFRRD